MALMRFAAVKSLLPPLPPPSPAHLPSPSGGGPPSPNNPLPLDAVLPQYTHARTNNVFTHTRTHAGEHTLSRVRAHSLTHASTLIYTSKHTHTRTQPNRSSLSRVHLPPLQPLARGRPLARGCIHRQSVAPFLRPPSILASTRLAPFLLPPSLRLTSTSCSIATSRSNLSRAPLQPQPLAP